MNHHCLARKEKENTIYLYKDEICKTQKLSLPNNSGSEPEYYVHLGRIKYQGKCGPAGERSEEGNHNNQKLRKYHFYWSLSALELFTLQTTKKNMRHWKLERFQKKKNRTDCSAYPWQTQQEKLGLNCRKEDQGQKSPLSSSSKSIKHWKKIVLYCRDLTNRSCFRVN